jgi:hypothetical protein
MVNEGTAVSIGLYSLFYENPVTEINKYIKIRILVAIFLI